MTIEARGQFDHLDRKSKSLIITCNSLGFSHSANSGSFQALRGGIATSARLMVPGHWANDAKERYRKEDIGISIVLNSNNPVFHLRPLTDAPSLLDGSGGFPATLEDLWDHADTEEVHKEARAQIERAILWGFDPTHLATHQNAMVMRPEFFDILVDLALEFSLPIAISPEMSDATLGFPAYELARTEGIVSPDRTILSANLPLQAQSHPLELLDYVASNIEHGITELVVSAAIDTPELRALDQDWATSVAYLSLLESLSSFHDILRRANITLIGYEYLRQIQREGITVY